MGKINIVSLLIDLLPDRNKEGHEHCSCASGSYFMIMFGDRGHAYGAIRRAMEAHVIFGNLSTDLFEDEFRMFVSACTDDSNGDVWLKAEIDAIFSDGSYRTRLTPVLQRSSFVLMVRDGRDAEVLRNSTPQSTRQSTIKMATVMSNKMSLLVCRLGTINDAEDYKVNVHSTVVI